MKKPTEIGWFFGAGDEARTRYLHLGKVALYRMSYTRIGTWTIIALSPDLSILFFSFFKLGFRHIGKGAHRLPDCNCSLPFNALSGIAGGNRITGVFPHFPYFRLGQNLTPNLLVPLCGAALKIRIKVILGVDKLV